MGKGYIRTFIGILLILFSSIIGDATEIKISAGKFAYFEANIPSAVVAGEKVNIVLTAMDQFGNVITNFSNQNRNFAISSTSNESIEPSNFSSKDFKNGMFTLSLKEDRAGELKFAILEKGYPVPIKSEKTGSITMIQKVNIINGPAYSYQVSAPKTATAGYDFPIDVIALDKYNNVVRNYSINGDDVLVTLTPTSKDYPSIPYTLRAYRFVDGKAKMFVRYDYPTSVVVKVSDINNPEISGSSNEVALSSPSVSRFVVEAPKSVVAGEKFPITIKVLDDSGNLVRNYNIIGKEVYLAHTGSGKLIPDRVDPKAFVNGVARVYVMYTKSEPITITAYINPPHIEQKQIVSSKPKEEQKPKEETTPVKKFEELLLGQKTKEKYNYKNISTEKPTSKSFEKRKYHLFLRFPKSYGYIKGYSKINKSLDGKQELIYYIAFKGGIKGARISRVVKNIEDNGNFLGKLIIEPARAPRGEKAAIAIIIPSSKSVIVENNKTKKLEHALDITITY